MNVLTTLSVGVSALGWCLLHFVWQAAAIGVAYVLVRAVLPRGNPRYLAAMLALIAMAACPIVTGVHEFSLSGTSVELADMTVTAVPAAASPSIPSTPTWQALLGALLPWLVLAWAIGAGALGVRVYRQWRGLRRMLAAAEQLPEWQARARRFADRLGLRRVVPVLASVRVATPTLVGWVKPAVVLPLAVLARMPAAQIDLVLAHELAHLKRLDHIANLFQVVLETLFFYHPAVHWISREARNERELCCDALALRVTGGQRRDFVAALAGLEAFRSAHAELALAATGGVLVERAWFIAGAMPGHRQHRLRTNAPVMLAVAVMLGLGWMWWRDTAWQQRTAMLLAASNTSVLQQTRRDAVSPPALSPLPQARLLATAPRLPLLRPVLAPAAEPATVMPAAVRVAMAKPQLTIPSPALSLAPIAAIAAGTVPGKAATLRVLHGTSPEYPPQALVAGVQGRVVIGFTVDASGKPRDLEVVDSSSGLFNAAALQALAEWRFAAPATTGRRYQQAFTFRLGTADASDGAATDGSCVTTTGTHICRHVLDTGPGMQ